MASGKRTATASLGRLTAILLAGTFLSSPAWAGGTGGNGGASGVPSVSGSGGAGSSGRDDNTGGAAGGTSAGGFGGGLPGQNGANGGSNSSGGGGGGNAVSSPFSPGSGGTGQNGNFDGGDGGAAGQVVSGSTTIAAPIAGANGADGVSTNLNNLKGSGGGGGGDGAVLTGSGTVSVQAAVQGGAGGAGGSNTLNAAAGGGGGGGAGIVSTSGSTLSVGAASSVAGGSGGAGGSSSGTITNGAMSPAGAGGGGGGAGIALPTGGSLTVGTGSQVTGGSGAAGGDGANNTVHFSGGAGGGGGSGGAGVIASGAVITNSGTIAGGTGGGGGAGGTGTGGTGAAGSDGAGGAGIVGSGVAILNSGTITGGLGGDGSTRANAITFTGGGNTLRLDSGSTITGNIDVTGSVTFAQGTDATLSNVISGTGFVGKIGVGVLTLSGANTYTGGTTVSVGTLAISSNANLGDASGALAFGGGTLRTLAGITIDRNVTFIGGGGTGGGTIDVGGSDDTGLGGTGKTIVGGGGLTKTGSGRLILNGFATYSGPTNVNQGTLAIGGSSASAASAFTVASGAALQVFGGSQTIGSLAGGGTVTNAFGIAATLTTGANGTSTTFSGVLQNGGPFFTDPLALTKTGGGTLTLSGANTYTGFTAVDGGTLALAGSGSIASSLGLNLTTAGAAFDISASGGNQTVQLLMGVAGTTVNLGANTLNTGTNNSTIFAGQITGTGGLVKQGTGTLTLGGANSYSGGTTVSGGTLQGNSTSLQGDIVNTAALVFDQTTAGTYAGDMSGTGAFVKQGAGLLNLTGTNSVGGGTTVAGGALAVNGTLTGDVTVGGGGTLGGSGTIAGAVGNSGIVAPGNSIGTLNIVGSYTHAAGSTYQVEVNAAGQSDLINVTGAPGTATINGGTVQVLAEAGSYGRSTTYTILTATGGVTGTFSNVTSNFAFLTPSLAYDANNVFLTLFQSSSAFASGAQTSNQFAVGTVLDAANATASGDFNTVLNALAGLDTTQGPKALDAISGQPYASFGTANVAMGYAFANAVGNQMPGQGAATRVALAEACNVSCDTASRWGAWLSGLAGTGSVLGQANNSGAFTYNFGGTAVGLDYRLDPRFLVGVGLGYTTGTQWVSGFNGRGTVDAFSGSLYGSFTEGAVYVNALAGYSRANNRLTRTIVIPGLAPRTAYGQTTADQFLGQVETGYRFEVGPGSVTPFARLQGSTTNQAAFTESGADSLNLTVAQQTTNSLRTVLGAELQGQLGPVDARLRLGWQHEHADVGRPLTASFAGAPGSAFTVYGATPQRDSAVVGFGGRTRIGGRTELYARYDGELGGGTDNHAFNLGLRMTW